MRTPSSFAVFALVVSACGGPPEATAPGKVNECVAPPPATSTSAAPASSASTPPSPTSAADPTFLRTYAITRGFRLGTPKSSMPTPDGKAVLFLRSAARDPKQALYETDLATGVTRELLHPDTVAKGPETLSAEEKARRERLRITSTGFTAFDLSPDGSKVLVSLSGRLLAVTRATAKFVELPTGKGAAIDPHFSRDGARVAYVRDADVYSVAADGTGKESAITKGGTEAVTHGLAEFVAQEEFGRLRGFWWSPDGAKVLYEEADVRKVERLSIVDLAHPEKAPDQPAYPRAGKTNAEVRFGIVSSKGGATTWLTWDRAKYPYVTTVAWSGPWSPSGGDEKKSRLVLYVMDRLQKNAALLAVDVATGKTVTLLEEHDDAWINLDESALHFFADGGFLWSSEKSGQWQLELHDPSGKLIKAITNPDLGYREVLDVDETKKVAYIAASIDPTARAIWAMPLDGAFPKRLGNTAADVAMAKFGKGHDVFVTYEGTKEGSRKWFARSVDGKIARELPATAEHPTIRPIEYVTVGPDAMNVAIVRPKAFVAGKKYPVLDAAYGGPHAIVVIRDGASYARQQWMADATGAIVVAIDAKGTPFRGRAWERSIRDGFATVPLDGHVTALAELGKRFPEMDMTRVGVFGWSFGGYYAALAVLKRPDVYKVGMAGAPVIDWRDYDTAYTERYLGLPDKGANEAVYDANDVLTWAKKPLDQAPARPLLIVHGTADDNVYFFHSLKLTDALNRLGRPFEFMPLAGATHQLASPELNEAVWSRATDFLRARL